MPWQITVSRGYSPPPKRKHHSRSISPRGKWRSREHSYSPSPVRDGSPPYKDRFSTLQWRVRESSSRAKPNRDVSVSPQVSTRWFMCQKGCCAFRIRRFLLW